MAKKDEPRASVATERAIINKLDAALERAKAYFNKGSCPFNEPQGRGNLTNLVTAPPAFAARHPTHPRLAR